MAMSFRRHLRDALWLGAGQAVAAAGTLVGVRMLTQVLPPKTFGTVSIGLAGVALALATICTPLTQAVIHLYPAYHESARLEHLRSALLHAMRKAAWWWGGGLVLLVIGGILSASEWVYSLLLLVPLLMSDIRRSVQISVLNAARRHRRYAIWTASDAWARPLLATLAVMIVGHSVSAVFAAHLIVSLALTAAFSTSLWRDRGQCRTAAADPSVDEVAELAARMWRFAWPLVPVGLIGWSNNLGDRYIIGGMLGLEAAGVYAATFGLASAPFIMLTGVLEQAFRPPYQAAVSGRRTAAASRVLKLWMVATIALAGLGVAALVTWKELIASIFLGPSYRSAADLMPWIAIGYAIRASAHVFERVSYAHARTASVLAGQLCTAAATVLLTPLAILFLGLQGAALAVPMCFAVYLAAAALLARRSREDLRATDVQEHSAASVPLQERRA